MSVETGGKLVQSIRVKAKRQEFVDAEVSTLAIRTLLCVQVSFAESFFEPCRPKS